MQTLWKHIFTSWVAKKKENLSLKNVMLSWKSIFFFAYNSVKQWKWQICNIKHYIIDLLMLPDHFLILMSLILSPYPLGQIELSKTINAAFTSLHSNVKTWVLWAPSIPTGRGLYNHNTHTPPFWSPDRLALQVS